MNTRLVFCRYLQHKFVVYGKPVLGICEQCDWKSRSEKSAGISATAICKATHCCRRAGQVSTYFQRRPIGLPLTTNDIFVRRFHAQIHALE